MRKEIAERPQLRSSRRTVLRNVLAIVAVGAGAFLSLNPTNAQDENIDDISANYHFLTPEDTLAILDEEGTLKGYIEVVQPADESDDVLSYEIMEGSRTKNHLKFFTKTIHGKYFRFSGTAEHGKGHEQKDPDYLRLVGDLDVITVKKDVDSTGKSEERKETVQTFRVLFKSLGKSERPDG